MPARLPFGENQFDRALSMLVLHFVPAARQAVAEMSRVVRPGGVVAATVWDTFGGMPSQRIFWDTIAAIEPSAIDRGCAALVRPMTFPGEMAGAFAGAGLQDVTEATLTIRMEFAEFDDYWLPLINGQGTLAAFLSTLPNDIPEQVKARFPVKPICAVDQMAHAALQVWLGRSKELCQRPNQNA